MTRLMYGASLVVLVLTGSSASAQTVCRFFDVGRPDIIASGDEAYLTVLESGQRSCQTTFPASAWDNFKFTSISIVNNPSQGIVTLKSQGFVYDASAAFSGSDKFILNVCASSRAGSGCSKITYNVKAQ